MPHRGHERGRRGRRRRPIRGRGRGEGEDSPHREGSVIKTNAAALSQAVPPKVTHLQ